MNYFGGLAFGVISFKNFFGFPMPSEYQSIKIYGNAVYDNLHVKNIELTDAQILQIAPYGTPIWDGNTLLLATFNNNSINAGNYTGISSPPTQFEIFRKKTTETVFTSLGEIPITQSKFVDITAEPNVTYTYRAVAKNATEISEPIQGNLVSDFYNSYLIDIDTKEVYVFDINLEYDGTNNEVAYQRKDGYSKFSSYEFGERDFKTGEVVALVSESVSIDGYPVQPIEYLDKVQAFINNGKPKIFKDRKGSVMRVVTVGGLKQSPININISQQPYVVAFSFEQCGEVGDIFVS